VIPTAMGRGNRWRMPYDEVLEKNETTSCGLLRYLSGFGQMNARQA
jgi:hypothetical protein